ncbi:MAG TPA: DUF2809 domain-containing protein [Planctomycetaceae bacterium]|nr:DUF2809 domain-containing protein [Planctomycetaceae bacterium]
MRRRSWYFLAAIVAVALGLASRRFRASIPTFLGEYAGDTLWALMVFCVIGCFLPHAKVLYRAILAYAFSCTVEFSQLYHAPWIDAVRSTTLGSLVLGHGFLATDLVCYGVGIVTGAVVEWQLSRHGSAIRPHRGDNN